MGLAGNELDYGSDAIGSKPTAQVNSLANEAVLLAYDAKNTSRMPKCLLKPIEPIVDHSCDKPKAEPVVLTGGIAEKGIDWDPWRKQVLTTLVHNIQRRVSAENEVGNEFAEGARTNFSLQINKTAEGIQVTNIRITKSSGDAEYDQLIVKAIRDLNRQHLPNFPKGSQRTSIIIKDNVQTAPKGSGCGVNPEQTGDIE